MGVVLAAAIAAVAAQEQPRFRSGVSVVEVAVVARDADGRIVRDLRRDEIAVLENGAAQEVVGFEHVSVPAAPATATPAMASDVSTNEHADRSRVYMLVLDAQHVAPERNITVRQYARAFVERYVGPEDLAAVFSPGADIAATEDFTSDKARLLAAIDRFTGSKLRSATIEREEDKRRFYNEQPVFEGRDPSDPERASRAYALTTTLEALARHLDRVEGRRKALLLFSEGVDYDTADVLGERQRYASEVMRSMGRAVGALMRTNVAMYTVDPRGLGSEQGDLVQRPVYERNPGDPADFSERQVADERAASVRSLRELAGATGGFLATDKGLDRAFAQIVEESSDYYVVAYSPAKAAKPGETRSIAVRVSRPGVSVVARRGYAAPAAAARSAEAVIDILPAPSMLGSTGRTARPPSMPRSEPATPVASTAGIPAELAALLASPLPKPGLTLRVQAIPFRGGGRKSEVQLVVEVLGRDLRFTERGGRSEERLGIALMTVDDKGKGGNGRNTTIDLRLSPEELQRVRSTGVRWLTSLDLEPGRYQLRVAGQAVNTVSSGFVTHTIDVPRFGSGGVSMSGIALTSLPALLMVTRGKTRLEEALPQPPSATRTFVAGDRLTAAVEVDAPEAVSGTLAVTATLEAASRPGSLRLTESRPEKVDPASRAHVFVLDTGGLPPDRYVLTVGAAASSGNGARAERKVAFEVVSRR